MIVRFLEKCFGRLWAGFNWLIMEMDVTQWGIVAVIFVVMGFFALRTRL